MQIDVIQTQQKAAIQGIPSISPVAEPSSSAAPENVSSGLFGPAYIREGQRNLGETFAQYGADGTLTNGAASSSGEADLADARAVRKLEARDRQVREKEESKGEAVGDRNYIYQTGPDGKQYAIGTSAHTVRKEDPQSGGESAERGADGKKLSRENQDLVERLEARDAKVKSHEAAHIMASGGQAGMASYTYQTGPDGKRYAVGGSVNISTMSTGDAETDAMRARKTQRAAMATGEPSAQDLKTAMQARSMEMEVSQKERDTALQAYRRQGAFMAA